MRRKIMLLLLCTVLLLPDLAGIAVGWGNRALAAVLEAEPAADEEMGEEFSVEVSDGMVSPQGSGMYNPAAPHIIDVRGYTSGRQMRWAKAGQAVDVHVFFDKPVYYESGRLKFSYGPGGEVEGVMDFVEGHLAKMLVFRYIVPDKETREINYQAYDTVPYDSDLKVMFKVLGWEDPESVKIDSGTKIETVTFAGMQYTIRTTPDNNVPVPFDPEEEANDILKDKLLKVYMDNVPPTIERIWTNAPSGTYGMGDKIYIGIEFSEKMFSIGSPQPLVLSNGATYTENIVFSPGINMPYAKNPNWDTNSLQLYTPRFGESTKGQFLSVDVFTGSESLQDQAGNPIDGNLAVVPNLDDARIIIDVPDIPENPSGRAFQLIIPDRYETYVRELPTITPYLVGTSTPLDRWYFCYYWDQSDDPDKAQARYDEDSWKFDPLNPKEGWSVARNTEQILGPEGDSAGAYYLHYMIRTLDRGAWRDPDMNLHWTVGPYFIDRLAPTVSFPWGEDAPLNTRYMVPVEVAEPHSGLVNEAVNCQWLSEGGVAYGGVLQLKVTDKRAWAIAPEVAGKYSLKAWAIDNAGNESEVVTSVVYTIKEAEGVPNTAAFTVIPRDLGSRFRSGLPLSWRDFIWQYTIVQFIDDPKAILGHCFYAWLPPGMEDVPQDDGRWQRFYDGSAGGYSYHYPWSFSVPRDLPSGQYCFHIMAFDQFGNPSFWIYEDESRDPVVITVDNTPPTIEFTPNGAGSSNNLSVDVVLRDNFDIPVDGWAGATFGLTDLEDTMGHPYLLNAEEMHPEPVDGVYPYLKWRVTLPTYDELLEVSKQSEPWKPWEWWELGSNRLYVERPAPPFRIRVFADDDADNNAEVYSNPFYLDVRPPQVDVTVANSDGKVYLNQNLILNVDTHGEAEIEYCYAFDVGEEGYIVGWEDGQPVSIPHLYIAPEDPAWSRWQRVQGTTISLLSPYSESSHTVSLRFRDKWGNEWRYPERFFKEPYNEEDEGDFRFLDMVWHTTLKFEYIAHFGSLFSPVQLTYSTLNWTNQDVVVTLKGTDLYGNQVVMEPGTSNTHRFTENGSHTFKYKVGEERHTTVANVSWIDKTPPKVEVWYSTTKPTAAGVSASIYTDEDASVRFVEADGTNDGRHFFTENGTHDFTVYDLAGNSTTVTAEVNNIDRTPPEITVEYQAPERREGKVGVILRGNEEFVVAELPQGLLRSSSDVGRYTPSVSKTYYASENAEYTLICQDVAGNARTVTVSVKDVRSEKPVVRPVVYPSTLTRESVRIGLSCPGEQIWLLDEEGKELSENVEVAKNGAYAVRYKDAFGNIFSETVYVTNIDSTPPVIHLSGWKALVHGVGETVNLKEGVTANDNRDGDITSSIGIEHDKVHPYNPDVPGTYTVTYVAEDEAGNVTRVTRDVRVVQSSSLVVYINGQTPDLEGKVYIAGKTLTIQCFGTRGQNTICWWEGARTEGVFKYITGDGKDAGGKRYGLHEGDTFTLELTRGDWYTFYVRDGDQQTKHIQVCVDYR